MSNRVIVVGYLGNMGKRYTHILDNLYVPWFGIEEMGIHYDRQRKEQVSTLDTNPYHSVILCTPTSTHMKLIKKYRNLNLPILCEKPVSYKLEDIEWIIQNKIPVKMVNQYQYLQGTGGATYYDYYNSGKDGLKWDCINIIGLAGQDKAKISNESAVWKCRINGKELNRDMVDEAYIDMIADWVKNPKPDTDYMLKAHKRVLEGFYEKGTNRDSSKVNQQKATGKSSNEDRAPDNVGQSDISLPKDSGVRRGQKRASRKRGSIDTAG